MACRETQNSCRFHKRLETLVELDGSDRPSRMLRIVITVFVDSDCENVHRVAIDKSNAFGTRKRPSAPNPLEHLMGLSE